MVGSAPKSTIAARTGVDRTYRRIRLENDDDEHDGHGVRCTYYDSRTQADRDTDERPGVQVDKRDGGGQEDCEPSKPARERLG
ncbi:hypothetical protein RW1_084_00110 [Rhodococcus wratislaviensis NBRC 100605]|uniref:Uncharacterized protein n=1 Tax=Rhodococcus wratislaviensis NBRC 100605 TaxID=1219028 RepID=X0QD23_RHOWR|nr:hypothetical protein RW1_084_00110 [Rhodococcus wratislaviensis NBRC 100605]